MPTVAGQPLSAPTSQRGQTGIPSSGAALGGVDGFEETPELRWPAAGVVFDRMRKEDSQIASVWRAIYLAMTANTPRIEGAHCRPEVNAHVRRELGLAGHGEGTTRPRGQGIEWAYTRRHSLLRLIFGFMPLEYQYLIGPPTADLAAAGAPPLIAYLHKLSPRMPRTIDRLEVADDGGLVAAHQFIRTPRGFTDTVPISVDRLVMFTHEREGADWYGNSILRSVYKNWLIKDALLRFGPSAIERNGMGIPFVTGEDASLAAEIAAQIRTGEYAGGGLPTGYTVQLLGVTGTVRDELPLVKYHDESIGRGALAMFLNLGHDRGSQSLGETFLDYFLLACNSAQGEEFEVWTEHTIRDIVELNFGAGEPYPSLVADPVTPEQAVTATAMQTLVDAGLLFPDEAVRADVRRRFRLPAPTPVEPVDDTDDTATGAPAGDAADAAASPFASVGLPALVEAGIISGEEARGLLGIAGPAPAPPPSPAMFASLDRLRALALSGDVGARRALRAALGLPALPAAALSAPAAPDATADRIAALQARLDALASARR